MDVLQPVLLLQIAMNIPVQQSAHHAQQVITCQTQAPNACHAASYALHVMALILGDAPLAKTQQTFSIKCAWWILSPLQRSTACM